AIARAIVNRPKVVIADAPTGNLDIETALDIMNIFTRINERGTTIVMATHNADSVITIRHRVSAIEGGIIVRDVFVGGFVYEG
ncbi:cell division ATP-binding protein FtsE, partial [Bacillus cereus]|nr:cell division ATP-binding protein FtsE [Bacillus cereus]